MLSIGVLKNGLYCDRTALTPELLSQQKFGGHVYSATILKKWLNSR